jgi:Ca2+-binding EF-hand superfamily protein
MKTYLMTAALLLTVLTFVTTGDAQDKKTSPADGNAMKEKKQVREPAAQELLKNVVTSLIDIDHGTQDFVFLADARPLLVRVQTHINGKPLAAAYDEFAAHLFRYADINKDGFLNQDELDRTPTFDQIRSGGPSGYGFFGGGGGGGYSAYTVKELDTSGDGKVDLAEFTAYLRKSNFAPFQLEAEREEDLGMMMYMGPTKSQPSIDAVSNAIFAHLDTNKDGKISKEELTAAPEVLRKLDANEDDMLTAREIAPNDRPSAGRNGMMMGSMGRGPKSLKDLEGSGKIILVAKRGEAPNNLTNRLQATYSSKGKRKSATELGEWIDWGLKSAGLGEEEPIPGKQKAMTLTRADLGLDAETFAALDTNRDGKLDAKELAGFVNRTPDLELVVRLGMRKTGEDRVQILVGKGRSSLAGKIKTQTDLAMVDLGNTRAELRGKDGSDTDGTAGFMRQQSVALFKQADRKGNGYIEEKDSQNFFGRSFKAMDRNGDGKVSEQEFLTYLDDMAEMKKRVNQACVTLSLTDESRGLFDLIDVNRDGKLSARELRGAVKLLETLDLGGKGYITRADIPRSYRLTVRRGPANGEDSGYGRLAVFYGLEVTEEEEAPTAGPAWFRKMDRNRDGDISRSEWLGSDELFRRIDADGDGLISLEEAERYDAEQRRRK